MNELEKHYCNQCKWHWKNIRKSGRVECGIILALMDVEKNHKGEELSFFNRGRVDDFFNYLNEFLKAHRDDFEVRDPGNPLMGPSGTWLPQFEVAVSFNRTSIEHLFKPELFANLLDNILIHCDLNLYFDCHFYEYEKTISARI